MGIHFSAEKSSSTNQGRNFHEILENKFPVFLSLFQVKKKIHRHVQIPDESDEKVNKRNFARQKQRARIEFKVQYNTIRMYKSRAEQHANEKSAG